MDFLSRHYEKLILAFCLLCLLGSMGVVMTSIEKTRKNLRTEEKSVTSQINKGELLSEIEDQELSSNKYLNDARKRLNVLGILKQPTLKGSLIEPNKFIKCKNEKCKYIIALSAAKCPFCGTEQPELAKETELGDDTDRDGIPDMEERKYSFLNFRDPMDARLDYDRDGFLNLEEFRAGSKMDDFEDWPALGYLLRVRKVFRQKINLILVGIDKNNSEDPKKWDVNFSYKDPRKKKGVGHSSRQIGETIKVPGGVYKVEKAEFKGEGDVATPFVVISNDADSTEQYTLEKDVEVQNSKVTVQMVYLANRERNYAANVVRRNTLSYFVGEEFKLTKNKQRSQVTEYYKILSANESDSSVKLALLKGSGGDVDKEMDLDMFNPTLDFITDSGRGGVDEMDGGAGMDDRNNGGRVLRRGGNLPRP